MVASVPALVLLLLFIISTVVNFASCNHQTAATYIVLMNPDHKPSTHPTHDLWYRAHLQSLSIDPSRHLLYTYSSALQGFAASLLPHHLPLLRRHPAVAHLLPDPLLSLHTTRSPYFLGLPPWPPSPIPSSSSSSSAAAHDVIIGVLDTGVWPESPSFDDAGLPEIPSRWRGACEAGVDFPPSLCNRKLIGARSFSRGFHSSVTVTTSPEYVSARDVNGHGTHTASTAAGSPVANASLLGYAPGTARGMAPGARVAAYKVCWSSGCFGSDILAAMDQAIADGVDVLSLSLGGGSAPYSRDPIAIGALAAVQRGIIVACSAGNNGPGAGTLANTAPWIATVGAGTLDRDFPAYAELGNGERYTGVSLDSGEGIGSKTLPIVYAKGAHNSSNLCMPGSLDPAMVSGKVVVCDRGINARVQKGEVVRDAGGVAMILANNVVAGEELVADSHVLPAVAVGARAGERIRQYVESHPSPVVVLSFGGTVLDVRPSPVVAAFSSRGPSTVSPQILKPDMIGPGVNILAGWSGAIAPSGLEKDDRRSNFSILSGTSMSCPHISGVAALLKAAHPDWSPSAIKSALMTTAYTMDNTESPLRDAAGSSEATPLSYGSGHIDPQKALSPGLIYDITTEDYVAFLCSLDYTSDHIQAIAKGLNITCSRKLKDLGNLNYPSLSVIFGRKRVVKYSRELTNVGSAGSVYNVKFSGPSSVNVMVRPTKLVFKQAGQKLRYSITFTWKKGEEPMNIAFGWITWSNEEHQVQSPVAYTWKMF